MRILLRFLIATAALLLIAACAAPAGHIQPPPVHCTAVHRAVDFLVTQYDPAAGLLREAPISAPHVHWLATDNLVALAALRAATPCAPAAAELAARISRKLAAYGSVRHGLIEAVIGGETPEWPPRTATQFEVEPGVWREERLSGAVMEDWRQYADLAFLGVLKLAQAGEQAEAQALYAETLALFDGTGFVDKADRPTAADGTPDEEGVRYASYKLALALLAAGAAGVTPDARLLPALLAQQNEAGGFYAHYRSGGGVNDANTETTAYTILALMAFQP